MTRRTVKALLADAARSAECRAARRAWMKETADAWLKAHRAVDDFLTGIVGKVSEEEFERLCDAELGKVDAMMAQLRAAADEDRWPRELYRGGL